jgi:hypothetical protein
MRLHLIALALAATLSSGCFVFDEIDKGQELMDSHSATRNKDAKAKAAAADAKDGDAPATPEEKKKQWWASATSLSTADQAPKKDPHIRCRIERDERFMRQSDCLSQGGKVL